MFKSMAVILMALSLFVTSSFAGDDDPVIAEAGKYIFKKSDLDRNIGYLTPDKQKHLLENPQQKAAFVERMMQVKIISDIAREKGLDKKDDVKDRMQYMIDDFLSREYFTNVILKDITASEEDLQQYYTLNKNKFLVPEQVKARHILVKVSPDASAEEKKKAEEKIKDLLKKIKEGGDFAKLAQENSDDPGSKEKGGDIGFFGKGRMVKPFEDAAFSLKPGQVSDVVETKFGYHIIKVEDYKEAGTKTFEEVKDLIKKQLEMELGRTKATEFIKKAVEDAGMKIYTDKLTGVPAMEK